MSKSNERYKSKNQQPPRKISSDGLKQRTSKYGPKGSPSGGIWMPRIILTRQA